MILEFAVVHYIRKELGQLSWYSNKLQHEQPGFDSQMVQDVLSSPWHPD
jgi:hypothetical protein